MTHLRTRTPYGWAACIFLALTLLLVIARVANGQPTPTPTKLPGFGFPDPPPGACACVWRDTSTRMTVTDCFVMDLSAHPFAVNMSPSTPIDSPAFWRRYHLHEPGRLYYPPGHIPPGEDIVVKGYLPGRIENERALNLWTVLRDWCLEHRADTHDCVYYEKSGEAWEDIYDWAVTREVSGMCPQGIGALWTRGAPPPIPPPQPIPEPTPASTPAPPEPAPTTTAPPASPCPPGQQLNMIGRCAPVGPAPQPQPTPPQPMCPPVVSCPSCPVVECPPAPPPFPACPALSDRSQANLKLIRAGVSVTLRAQRHLANELASPRRKGCVQP